MSRSKYQQTVINKITELFEQSSHSKLFVRRLKRLYPSTRFLGKGISRKVYSLPGGMVCKVGIEEDQNALEFHIWCRRRKLAKYMPTIHAYLKDDKAQKKSRAPYEVLISERIRILHHIMRRYRSQFDHLTTLFEDCNGGNVGYVRLDRAGRRRKLLIADAGCGSAGPE